MPRQPCLTRLILLLAFSCLGGTPFRSVAAPAADRVAPIPAPLRRTFNLDPFYQKHIDVGGLPVVGSSNVSDFALLEAAWIVRRLLPERGDLLRAMGSNQVRLAVMAWNEFTTDIPEHRRLKSKVYWDRRARGLGATREAPAVSCGEENLLGYPGDPYATENLLIHEFAHAIHGMGLPLVDPEFAGRLREAYRAAQAAGRWQGTYAATSVEEYWAEGVQDWFDDNRENDALHNHVNTRVELKAYDPALAELCARVFGDGPWRYLKPSRRPEADRAHLAGYDPAQAPRFRWRPAAIPETPRVLIQTAVGDIELELDPARAPLTVTNFLHYVHEGLFADGSFFRTVRADNQPTNTVKIAVIQAEANPARTNEFRPPIPLERTRDTGLRHRDGTVSMARLGPDTAQENFFICVGDQPELDFAGKRNPDGQGFAAFGRVTKGMDVVRKIHQGAAREQQLTPSVRIQRAIRLN